MSLYAADYYENCLGSSKRNTQSPWTQSNMQIQSGKLCAERVSLSISDYSGLNPARSLKIKCSPPKNRSFPLFIRRVSRLDFRRFYVPDVSLISSRMFLA